MVDHEWMLQPTEVFEKLDPITADFAYIRWLGDRKGIEEITKTWDRPVVDRSAELREWVKATSPNGEGPHVLDSKLLGAAISAHACDRPHKQPVIYRTAATDLLVYFYL
jgi:hypothetical protein